MLWSVHVVKCLWQDRFPPHVLPPGVFIISDGTNQKETKGWLPCHHGNVQYTLEFQKNGDIRRILHMKRNNGKKRPRLSLKSFNSKYTRKEYLLRAENAYKDHCLWTIAVLYTSWSIYTMDIQAVYNLIVEDPERICHRYSKACRTELCYQPQKALETINRALAVMGEPPFADIEGFNARMEWQRTTRYSTAALKSPGSHIRQLQRYQELWTTSQEIETAKIIGQAITPENCTLVLGTPFTPVGQVVVRTEEEAFQLQCWAEAPNVVLLSGKETLTDVCIPFAHTWGVEDWVKLCQRSPQTYTCIGRLDQYTRGRGQIFRNMVDASFPITKCRHYTVPYVQMVTTENVADFVHNLPHKIVQCFSEEAWTEIDTNRRWIANPRRIRTIATRDDVSVPRIALMEEYFTLSVGKNASVVPCWTYNNLPVDVVVYLCNHNTRAFDIHVARTHCRSKLYVVNCTTNPDPVWEHKAPNRITISPFK